MAFIKIRGSGYEEEFDDLGSYIESKLDDRCYGDGAIEELQGKIDVLAKAFAILVKTLAENGSISLKDVVNITEYEGSDTTIQRRED